MGLPWTRPHKRDEGCICSVLDALVEMLKMYYSEKALYDATQWNEWGTIPIQLGYFGGHVFRIASLFDGHGLICMDSLSLFDSKFLPGRRSTYL